MKTIKAKIRTQFDNGEVSIVYVCPTCGNQTSTIEDSVGEVGEIEWTCGRCHTIHWVYWKGYNRGRNE